MSHNSSHNVKPPHALVNKCTSPGFLTVESEEEYNSWLDEEAELLEEEGDDDDW